MSQPKIGFIGAGNMASSLIGGLLEQGYPASLITACDPSVEQLDRIKACHPRGSELATSTVNQSVSDAQVVVLAVKPQIMGKVVSVLKLSLIHI